MDMEKVKAFAVRILEECEQEGPYGGGSSDDSARTKVRAGEKDLRDPMSTRRLHVLKLLNKAVIKVFILVCKPFAVFRGCG